MTERISLMEAISRYRREDGAPVNTYAWYRKQAHERGSISIGQFEASRRKN